MNADMLNGDCISVLEYRSVALSVVGRERLPLSKQCSSHIILCSSAVALPDLFDVCNVCCTSGNYDERKTLKNPGGYYSLSESPLADTWATILLGSTLRFVPKSILFFPSTHKINVWKLGEKQYSLEGTHTNTRRTCKVHTEIVRQLSWMLWSLI